MKPFDQLLSRDTIEAYPVTLSLLARLSLFGVDLGRGASSDDRHVGSAKALKARDACGQKRKARQS